MAWQGACAPVRGRRGGRRALGPGELVRTRRLDTSACPQQPLTHAQPLGRAETAPPALGLRPCPGGRLGLGQLAVGNYFQQGDGAHGSLMAGAGPAWLVRARRAAGGPGPRGAGLRCPAYPGWCPMLGTRSFRLFLLWEHRWSELKGPANSVYRWENRPRGYDHIQDGTGSQQAS